MPRTASHPSIIDDCTLSLKTYSAFNRSTSSENIYVPSMSTQETIFGVGSILIGATAILVAILQLRRMRERRTDAIYELA